jgi:histidinol-phosphate phosphatase family protein
MVEAINNIGPIRAVFLDRDGTLNEDHGYVGQEERFHIYPFVGEALKLFVEKGFSLFIVTNQSGIERGYFKMEDTHRLHSILAEKMKSYGVEFKEIFICPHLTGTQSDTRKPSPKFVLDAAKKYNIDLSNSYVIGDRNTDLEMGYRAGCRVVLVRTGAGKETEAAQTKFDYVFDDLFQAAKFLK